MEPRPFRRRAILSTCCWVDANWLLPETKFSLNMEHWGSLTQQHCSRILGSKRRSASWFDQGNGWNRYTRGCSVQTSDRLYRSKTSRVNEENLYSKVAEKGPYTRNSRIAAKSPSSASGKGSQLQIHLLRPITVEISLSSLPTKERQAAGRDTIKTSKQASREEKTSNPIPQLLQAERPLASTGSPIAWDLKGGGRCDICADWRGEGTESEQRFSLKWPCWRFKDWAIPSVRWFWTWMSAWAPVFRPRGTASESWPIVSST